MCGIAGIFQFGRPVDAAELERFTKSLSHRGPDGWHTVIDRDLGLGHTRLAILDLSDMGRCPMPYTAPSGKKYWITFNGEIFNFLELREALQKEGYRFQSDTDTEVIAAAYDKWGPDCLLHFNGMWAFALWDGEARKLFVARDRFGVKPLYYQAAGRFAFASELKSFLSLEGFLPDMEVQVLPLLFEKQRYDGLTELSILKGVKNLPGGHCMTVDSGSNVQIRRWWDTAAHLPKVSLSYEDQVAEFRELLLDAVRIRLRSDVPVGTCLSGGVDSSSIAGSMAHVMRQAPSNLDRCQKNWQRAFIAGFPGAANDETNLALRVAREVGASPSVWQFDSDEAARQVIQSQWSLDEPTGGYVVPIWSLYRELRKERVLVSLDGHGGDELLGGYQWYLEWALKDVNKNLFNDFHFALLPTILRNFDRSSMAHGIEVRMPLMDWRLVTYAFALPAESKIGGGYTKRILRDAVKGLVPDDIRLRRQKIGFNAPLPEWFNGGLVPLIEKVTSHRFWLDSPFFNGKALREDILNRSRAKAWSRADWDTLFQVSRLLNLILWQILFLETKRPELPC